MNLTRFPLPLLLAATLCAEPARPPLFEGLGNHRRAVTTSSPEAQRYFDQGLVWAFAFNHDEAIRSFDEAARLDPDCAMAYWGIALCHGPHINNPVMPEARSKAAWEALEKALAKRGKASPVERALIEALARRYADPAPQDRVPLDQAYAAAMKEVWSANRGDADIGHLYAESLMDLQPWDLWEKDGKPKGNTLEILAVLEAAISADPAHPGANHLYIHAVEASPFPAKGVPSADRLRDSVPGAGHLVHMPSHIDVQVGEWAKAAAANEKAIEADRRYREVSPRQEFYRVYMAHNHHFLAFASMMRGRSAEALRAAREMIAGVPAEFGAANAALVDPYLGIAIESLMRFGRWDDVLGEPEPPAIFPISRAKRLFARAAALGAKGLAAEARAEQAKFREAAAKVPAEAMMAINPAPKVLRIADLMLEGELLFREGRIDDSVKSLAEAVALEDELQYMEPPDWIQPVRHTLGAVLLKAGRVEEAEAVYRKDLEVWPENGWSLFGLWKCLEARGSDEAADAKRRFDRTWAGADCEICATCLCVPMEK
jgi:tetratricopeptide (TPR) repeat protein